MKTCVKCGKNVADGTKMCPDCYSMAFYTDGKMEGQSSLFFDWLLEKFPKFAIIVMSIILIGLIGFAILLFGGLL